MDLPPAFWREFVIAVNKISDWARDFHVCDGEVFDVDIIVTGTPKDFTIVVNVQREEGAERRN